MLGEGDEALLVVRCLSTLTAVAIDCSCDLMLVMALNSP